MTRDDLAKLRALAARIHATGDTQLVGSECRDLAQSVLHFLDKSPCNGEPHTCDQERIAAAEGRTDRALEQLARIRRLAEEACELAETAAGALSPLYRSEFYRRDGARIAAIREEIGK